MANLRKLLSKVSNEVPESWNSIRISVFGFGFVFLFSWFLIGWLVGLGLL